MFTPTSMTTMIWAGIISRNWTPCRCRSICVTLGVFFTFAYEKCGKNIWLPVVLHYLNNSMVLVWTGTADISNQIISWTDVAISAIMYGVVFLPFLAAKCYRKNK